MTQPPDSNFPDQPDEPTVNLGKQPSADGAPGEPAAEQGAQGWGQPQQPTYGEPAYGQQQPGYDPQSQPQYAQPPYGQPAYGQPQYAPPQGYGMQPYNPAAPYGIHPMTGVPYSDKSKLVAGLLQLLIPLGIGRMYIGDVGIGVAQLLVTLFTCGIGAIWPFIDGIMILVGDKTDSQGRPLRN